MLLLLAESKHKPMLPLSFFGGAASQLYYRRQAELQDRFGDVLLLLQDERKIMDLVKLGERMNMFQSSIAKVNLLHN